ncbi:site-specific integrase [Iodidimonas sp. SYSU 1G8]|uniref:tyrosine-type recombinase/integrase n=1 Tax=Iodidimonas sp. SYSU 1G8 TaxID=3133967 RepID=UPI0031FF1C95
MRAPVSLLFEHWPAAEQAVWLALFREADLGEMDGAASHLASKTRELHLHAWGRWLFWLQNRGELGASPSWQLLTPERGQAFLGSVAHLAPNTQAMIAQTLEQCALWMAPGGDWHWLKPIRARIRHEQHRRRDKRPRLVETQALVDLGFALMEDAQARAGLIPVRHLTRYRDGLMIAMLAACPLRLGNFTSIRLGQNLCHDGDRFRLRFDAAQVKNRRALDMPVPLWLAAPIKHYCQVIRPALLAGREEQVLWITKEGLPMLYWSVEKQLKAWTRKAFGHALNPHLLRDCAATSIALAAPAGVRIARDVLGHASLKTTEKHYIHADQIKAFTSFQRDLRPQARDRRVYKDPE